MSCPSASVRDPDVIAQFVTHSGQAMGPDGACFFFLGQENDQPHGPAGKCSSGTLASQSMLFVEYRR